MISLATSTRWGRLGSVRRVLSTMDDISAALTMRCWRLFLICNYPVSLHVLLHQDGLESLAILSAEQIDLGDGYDVSVSTSVRIDQPRTLQGIRT